MTDHADTDTESSAGTFQRLLVLTGLRWSQHPAHPEQPRPGHIVVFDRSREPRRDRPDVLHAVLCALLIREHLYRATTLNRVASGALDVTWGYATISEGHLRHVATMSPKEMVRVRLCRIHDPGSHRWDLFGQRCLNLLSGHYLKRAGDRTAPGQCKCSGGNDDSGTGHNMTSRSAAAQLPDNCAPTMKGRLSE